MTVPQPIYSRVVSEQVHEGFAALSGDRNPMHMDAIAARRTQAGFPVVHGVHSLLWALETAAANGRMASAPTQIKVKFLKWVYVGDTADLKLTGVAGDVDQLQVEVQGMPALTAQISYGPQPVTAVAGLAGSPAAPLAEALDLSFPELTGHKGDAYTASSEEARTAFPALSALIGTRAVAEIAACSYIVGMEAPGLHSMFSKLSLTLGPRSDAAQPDAARTSLPYAVTYLDERFRKGRVSVAGANVQGTLEVFIRVPPVQQAAMETVAKYVEPVEFAGVQALIIGGSRGLGELTAKLIAAGGGVPTITYALGKAEAEKVAGQIELWGGNAATRAYDVRQAPGPQLEALDPLPTHLFYFATNTIYRPKPGLLMASQLAEFMQFYVQGFYDLCLALLALRERAGLAAIKLSVFYPSTVFIEERPAGMTEYAMTKAAGEQLCVDMNQYLPGVAIIADRLPKLPTDQTAGVLPERETAAIDVLLPILRRMR